MFGVAGCTLLGKVKKQALFLKQDTLAIQLVYIS
jgi:hypothetical protein